MLMRSASSQQPESGDGSSAAHSDRNEIQSLFPNRIVPARTALAEHFRVAPSQERSGLDPATYQQLMIEVRQHTEACLAKPRITHTNLINALVERELAHYQDRMGLNGWRLRELNDELRCGAGLKEGDSRLFIFGQVDDGKNPSIFLGRWKIESGSKEAPIYFQVTAEAEIILQDRSVKPSDAERQAIAERGPAPWKLQVAKGTPMAAWLTSLYGTSTSGFIKGQYGLGVFTEALERACAAEGLTNMLLTRGRRDPGKQPWHVGSFFAYNGDFFLWNDWALDRSGVPVKVLAKIQPHCTIIRADADADQKVATS